jgi:hypothetical protein
MQKLWFALATLALFTSCSKSSGDDPVVFLPHVVGAQGEDLDKARSVTLPRWISPITFSLSRISMRFFPAPITTIA